jgi:hypothetical protein
MNLIQKASASIAIALAILIPTCTQEVARGQSTGVASSTPPMGWNSWDSYGTTMNEAQVKAKADWMAKHLKASGDFACVLFQYRLSD